MVTKLIIYIPKFVKFSLDTKEAAKVAKEWVKQQVKGREWLRGVGIGKEPDGTYCVRLYVSELNNEVVSELPESPVDGVKIKVEAVGDIKIRVEAVGR